jgi:hypothetical protein
MRANAHFPLCKVPILFYIRVCLSLCALIALLSRAPHGSCIADALYFFVFFVFFLVRILAKFLWHLKINDAPRRSTATSLK